MRCCNTVNTLCESSYKIFLILRSNPGTLVFRVDLLPCHPNRQLFYDYSTCWGTSRYSLTSSIIMSRLVSKLNTADKCIAKASSYSSLHLVHFPFSSLTGGAVCCGENNFYLLIGLRIRDNYLKIGFLFVVEIISKPLFITNCSEHVTQEVNIYPKKFLCFWNMYIYIYQVSQI